MNLLLLLSALLSALTGVGGSARAPQVAVAVGSVVAANSETRAAQRTVRPMVAMPLLAHVAGAPIAVVRVAVTGTPLWMTRRRE